MKVFSIVGIRASGKTTTIEQIIRELKRRGKTVSTIKTIFCPTFSIDDPKSNTARHKAAGASSVIAKGKTETALIIPEAVDNNKLLNLNHSDYVILEGDYEAPVPRIVCAHQPKEVEERMNDFTFAISGRLADQYDKVCNLPAFSALSQLTELVDLIEEKVYDRLPNVDAKVCSACGADCVALGSAIIQGEAKRELCTLSQAAVCQLCEQAAQVKLVQGAVTASTGPCQCGCHKLAKETELKKRALAAVNLPMQLAINGEKVELSHSQEAELKQLLASFVKENVHSIKLNAGDEYE